MAQTVRIIKSSKSAMQSGRSKAGIWLMEFEAQSPKSPDALIGWSSSSETESQISLRFDQLQTALDYAKTNGLHAIISDEAAPQFHPKSYADNFRSDRVRR
ncbi:MAG: ETC complex I subunit [Alphaproteobacteria bacterium]|nr:ETC complex I subunit [Alphaproteobacteria bacterium]